MKIAFEGQLLLSEQRTGIAWCAHNLVLELAQDPDNECVIQFFAPGVLREQKKRLLEYCKAGCKIEICTWFHNVFYKLLWTVVPIPYRLFFGRKPDITQFFNYAVPPGAGGKRVVFVYDLAYLDCPQTVHPKTRMWLCRCMNQSCRRADWIVTSSEFSKRRIHQKLHIPYGKIGVIPDAVDHKLYHARYPEKQICSVLKKYKIKRNYILYLGTIEPRKNIENIVIAYEKLCSQMQDISTVEIPQLVLAGKKGWLCDGIYARIREAKTHVQIRCTGYVEQQDAPVLMCGAKIFVFPSWYEGFGMPPLEAMACGTPTVVSRTASLPEVVADAGIKVSPNHPEEICMGMKRLLTDQELYNRLREAGLRRAQQFTWEHSAELLMEVYRKVVESA